MAAESRDAALSFERQAGIDPKAQLLVVGRTLPTKAIGRVRRQGQKHDVHVSLACHHVGIHPYLIGLHDKGFIWDIRGVPILILLMCFFGPLINICTGHARSLLAALSTSELQVPVLCARDNGGVTFTRLIATSWSCGCVPS